MVSMHDMGEFGVAQQVEEAQQWLALRTESDNARQLATPQQCIAIAQVHATLALAIATNRERNIP
jgi:hypothetical protein